MWVQAAIMVAESSPEVGPVDDEVASALQNDRVVDITTTGRKSGLPRRIEIVLAHLGDMMVISGTPGRPRSWYANLLAHPEFTVHLKRSVQADLPARAIPVRDMAERRVIMTRLAGRNASRTLTDVEDWVARAPLVKVELVA